MPYGQNSGVVRIFYFLFLSKASWFDLFSLLNYVLSHVAKEQDKWNVNSVQQVFIKYLLYASTIINPPHVSTFQKIRYQPDCAFIFL